MALVRFCIIIIIMSSSSSSFLLLLLSRPHPYHIIGKFLYQIANSS
jgi:hypothetical protein